MGPIDRDLAIDPSVVVRNARNRRQLVTCNGYCPICFPEPVSTGVEAFRSAGERERVHAVFWGRAGVAGVHAHLIVPRG
jgi:hypothetical protein